jgi:uncharacterized protein YqhQ
LEAFIKQNLIPLAVPVSYETLKLMKADGRKIVLTIVDDETEESSKELVKLLKAAASANRDLIFGYVGVKQLDEFADKFDTTTKLPKMVIWDKKDDYLLVSQWFLLEKKILFQFILIVLLLCIVSSFLSYLFACLILVNFYLYVCSFWYMTRKLE